MATVKNPWEEATSWTERKKLAAERYAARPEFSYDLANDPLYNQYREQYQRQARLAMLDTMGQARAGNGGYGSSYAMQAGQQAYRNQLAGLNDRIPELYSIALSRYENAGNDLLNRYNFAAEQEKLDAMNNRFGGGGYGSGSKNKSAVDLVKEATKVAEIMGTGSALRYIQDQTGGQKTPETVKAEANAKGVSQTEYWKKWLAGQNKQNKK